MKSYNMTEKKISPVPKENERQCTARRAILYICRHWYRNIERIRPRSLEAATDIGKLGEGPVDLRCRDRVARHVRGESFLQRRSAGHNRLGSFSSSPDGRGVTYRVPGLDKHSSRPRELAHQAFRRCEARDDPARCDTFHYILRVPCDQVPVVDNVLLSFHELPKASVSSRAHIAEPTHHEQLTSFLMIAPKLVNHISPVPLILYTHRPSPLNMALPRPCLLYSLTTPCVLAR